MRIGNQAAVLGSLLQEKRMEVIANNFANAQTPGYKKEGVRFSNFMFESTYTRMEQGPIKSTGNPLDIALSGEGFLRVQTPDGERYTRAGNLTLNKEKTLVTQDGSPVLGKGGPIQLSGTNVRIDPDGQIFDEGAPAGTLDLVDFPPETQLIREKKGYFKPSDSGTNPIPAKDCRVQQESLEGSNINIPDEMTHLIETTRIFEAHQKIRKSLGELDGQLINKLGSNA